MSLYPPLGLDRAVLVKFVPGYQAIPVLMGQKALLWLLMARYPVVGHCCLLGLLSADDELLELACSGPLTLQSWVIPGDAGRLQFAAAVVVVVVVVGVVALFELVCPVSEMEEFRSHDTVHSLGSGDRVHAFAPEALAGPLQESRAAPVTTYREKLRVNLPQHILVWASCCSVVERQNEPGIGIPQLSDGAAFRPCLVAPVYEECLHEEDQGHEELVPQYEPRRLSIVWYQRYGVLAGWHGEQRPAAVLQTAQVVFGLSETSAAEQAGRECSVCTGSHIPAPCDRTRSDRS